MVIGILYWNQWVRPIHFAITVSSENRLNLDPYLQMTGMGLRVTPRKDVGTDVAALERNLFEGYRFRGVNDPAVFKDEDAERLMGNYLACVLELGQSYQQAGQGPEMERLFRWAQERLPFSWRDYYAAGELLRQADQKALGAEYLDQAGKLVLAAYAQDPKLAYENTLALAGILLNSYGEYDRAEGLYRQAMSHNPGQWDAYYELAATLQAKGQPQQALDLLVQYRGQYGEVEELKKAEEILHRALNRGAAPAAPAQP
jgi:tetratricopeptide (TPR) repeat protein